MIMAPTTGIDSPEAGMGPACCMAPYLVTPLAHNQIRPCLPTRAPNAQAAPADHIEIILTPGVNDRVRNQLKDQHLAFHSLL